MHSTHILVLFLGATIQTCFSVQSVSLTFIGAELFFDLSTYNFAKGRAEVYEYTITAQEGNNVSLYLFQNNVNQYKVEAFDGVNKQGAPLAINIPTNVELMETSVPTVSSGTKMFIRVTPDQSDPNSKVDFQAVVTDYTQPDDCGNMVINVNKADENRVSVKFLTNQGKHCYYLIHANDPTNNQLLSQYIVSQPEEIDNFYLFKGLLRTGDHQLLKNDISTWASDKYMIVWPIETIDLAFAFTYLGNLDLDIAVVPGTSGQFMTNDFWQDAYPNLPDELTQSFKLRLSPPMTAIQVYFIKLLGTSLVTVNSYSNNKLLSTTQYFPQMMFGPFNITYGCDVLEVQYTTDQRNLPGGSGFYALYDDADNFPPMSSATVPQSTKKSTQTTVDLKNTVTQSTVTDNLHGFSSTAQSIPLTTKTAQTQPSLTTKSNQLGSTITLHNLLSTVAPPPVTTKVPQINSPISTTASPQSTTVVTGSTSTSDETPASPAPKPEPVSSDPIQTTTQSSGSLKFLFISFFLFCTLF